MLRITINRPAVAIAALMAVALTGCNDRWDEHYTPSSETTAEGTVYEMIKNNPELSTFGRMVDVAGYGELLNSSQTFTAWVPSNDALAGVDLNDVDEVKRVVANHIARFNVSSATPEGKGVRMYNGKMHYYEGNTFGGVAVKQNDIVLENGVIHILSSQIPYSYNIREYIDTHSSTSKLAEFLKRFDEEKFDEALSTPIDIDENGATVYDSVKVSYNRIFQHPVYGLGDILSEDSVFTMIVPDNMAWNRAYEQISPLFNVYDSDAAKADSIRDTQTSLAIMRDLIFRSRITDPFSMGLTITTSGCEIPDMGAFFYGTDKINASNGMIYTTSAVNYSATDTYNPQIDVEAENPTGRVRGTGTTIYTRVVSTDNPYYNEISYGSYIEVSATSVSRQPGVTFEVPNTLSGKYDIYASFVPASVDDASVTGDKTRVRFVLTYMGANGRSVEKAFADDSFLTNATEMTTIKVAEGFLLPVSNFYDNLWLMEDGNDESSKTCTTKLYIATNVTNAEFNRNELTRRFRVDRIYFVPTNE